MIFFAYSLAIIFTMARVLYRDTLYRGSRLAWMLVLIFIPGLGIVLYFLFGEARLGLPLRERYMRVSQAGREHYQQRLTDKGLDPKAPDEMRLEPDDQSGAAAEKAAPEKAAPIIQSAIAQSKDGSAPGLTKPDMCVDLASPFDTIAKHTQSINGFPVLDGHKISLMEDAADFLDQLIRDIDQARSSISILYYIWLDDHTGQAVGQALIRAAKRGVTVRVLVDSLGSRRLFKSQIWQDMRAAGIKAKGALPYRQLLKVMLTRRLDLRNHRKITVIDGHITYCGSQNCADPEFRIKARFAPWVDIMARVEGPVVDQNQTLFAVDWLQSQPGALDDFDFKARPCPEGVSAQIWGSGPTVTTGASSMLLMTLIGSAQRHLKITTPYFVPSEPLVMALCAAAQRGVNVELILPKYNDSFIVRYASQSYYPLLLRAGVHIYEYEKGLLHAKIITIDDAFTMIGSTNLDMRSFDLNYESNLNVYDEAFTQKVNARQEVYKQSCEPVTAAQVRHWTPFRYIWNNIFSTFGPIL